MPRQYPYNRDLVDLAKKLRSNSTLGEIMVWQRIKKGALFGYDFHRQKPIGEYIVDFLCVRLRLVVEIDGSCHAEKAPADRVRQQYLEGLGLTVLRYKEAEARFHLDDVLASIERWIESK